MLREAKVRGAGVEFTAGLPHREDWGESFKKWSEEVPLLVHNYFPPPRKPFVLNLASREEENMALCREALQLSAAAGAPFYSVHAGFAMTLKPEQLGDHAAQARESRSMDRDEAVEVFEKNVRVLAGEAGSLGMKLLLENNVVSAAHRRSGLDEALLMSRPREIREFLEKWGDLPVGLLLDVAHAKVTATTMGFSAEEFFDLSDRIDGLHLSDNDGVADSNRPFAEDAWFAPRVAGLSQKPAVIEVYGLDENGRREQWETLQSLFE